MQQQQILLLPKSLILHNHSRKSYTLHSKSSPNFTGGVFPPPQPESKVKRLSTFGFNPKPQFEQRHQRQLQNSQFTQGAAFRAVQHGDPHRSGGRASGHLGSKSESPVPNLEANVGEWNESILEDLTALHIATA